MNKMIFALASTNGAASIWHIIAGNIGIATINAAVCLYGFYIYFKGVKYGS